MGGEKTTRGVATHRVLARAEDAGKRLDVLLAERIPELSRRRARLLIGAGAVSIDARRVLVQSRPVCAGQEIVCNLQDFSFPDSRSEEMPAILHEDECLIAVDKPAGMPSHPTFARTIGTALQILEAALRSREGRKVPLWPLHRLDAATSGVLLFAKTQPAARAVNQNFARRRVVKRYHAIVAGVPSPETGEIRLALAEGHLRSEAREGGKEAVTRYRVVERFAGDRSLVDLEPLTGRMHQLRVHLAAIGHPVVGDSKYGGIAAARLMLHASRLELPHPRDGRPFTVESPLPAEIRAAAETTTSA